MSEYWDVYNVVRKDVDPEEIVLDRAEVVDWAWRTPDEIGRMMDEYKMVRSVGLRYAAYGAKLR